MKDNFENIDEMIAKVVANEASKEEIVWLKNWAKESPENEAYVNDSKNLFKQINSVKETQQVNVNAAWTKLNERIENENTRIIVLPKRGRTLQIAAAVVLLICMSFLLTYIFKTNQGVTTFTADTEMLEQKLPDGTEVFMNRNTKISYSSNSNIREVKLKGEAYFKVVHNDEQPFVISAGEILVKDIGTEFNVKAIPENEFIEVKVEEGEVQFYSADNEGLKLVKGEKARFNRVTKEFSKVNADVFDNTSSYRSKIFNFKQTKLQEAIDQLNDIYLCNIILGDRRLANCPLTVSFDNKPINEIIEMIAETLDLKVQHNGKEYILTGGACPNL